MALTQNIYWYMEDGKIMIVKDGTSDTGNVVPLTESGQTIRVYAKCLATDFDSDITDANKTNNLPNRWRRIIADLAISRGYDTIPSGDFELDRKQAGAFYSKYRAMVKSMVKEERGNQQSGGMIVPCDY